MSLLSLCAAGAWINECDVMTLHACRARFVPDWYFFHWSTLGFLGQFFFCGPGHEKHKIIINCSLMLMIKISWLQTSILLAFCRHVIACYYISCATNQYFVVTNQYFLHTNKYFLGILVFWVHKIVFSFHTNLWP